MGRSFGWLLLLCTHHVTAVDGDQTGPARSLLERPRSLTSASAYPLSAFLYLADGGSGSVYCSSLPIPTAVPVADATVTAGGASARTGWQGLFALPATSPDGEVAIDGQHPLTGDRISYTVPVQPASADYGAVTGYFIRSPDGTLVAGGAPTQQATGLYALRVWLDNQSCLPTTDGHFLFSHLPAGPHVLRGEAIYDGEVHQAEASVDVWAGSTCVPEVGETSAVPAPPLTFWWVRTWCRWGTPSGPYIGAAVVNQNGVLPTDPQLTMTVSSASLGQRTWTGTPRLYGIETATFEDGVVTAALNGTSITGQALTGGGIPMAERLKPPTNIGIEPNPVVIGQPALVRWSEAWSATGRPSAGVSLEISDRVWGGTQQTQLVRPYPDWVDLPVYYPRNVWVLRATDTAPLRPGVTYRLTVLASETVDHGSTRQTYPAHLTFTAVSPADVPPAPPTATQAPLPVLGDHFDGLVYYAQPPGQRPLADDLVISPYPLPHLVPATGAVVTLAGHSPQSTGRAGHLHLEGVAPGTHTLSIATENPTTGLLFSAEVTAEFVPVWRYTPQDTQGNLIGYLYGDGGRVWVGDHPGAGTPLLSSRAIVDGSPANPAMLQNLLPDSDGRVEVTLPSGPHRLQFEGIKDGQVWAATCNVNVLPGTLTTVSKEAVPIGQAGALNILGAQISGYAGLDSGTSLRVRAVRADGSFPLGSYPEGPPPLVTFGPSTFPTTIYRKVVDGWVWLHHGGVARPGEWDVDLQASTGPGRFRVWPSEAEFNVPGALIVQTTEYTFQAPGAAVGMVPWIKTYPCPLVAGKPGIVYWGASPNPAVYRFSARSCRVPLDLGPLGDPFRGLTQASSSRVRVLTREETRTWLDPTSDEAPYQLCAMALDSPFYNQQRQKWVNYITTQGGTFTTGKWLRLHGEHGNIRVNGVPKALPWAIQLDQGTTVALEAVPDRGYRFSQWSGSLGGSTSPAELTVDEDKDVTVQFEGVPPVAPELGWTGTSGYEQDGVNPDKGTNERAFRFSVTYSAQDGYPPLGDKVSLRVRRYDVETKSWVYHTTAVLAGGAADYVAGGEYHGSVRLGKGKYRYQFVARSSREGNLAATGDPYRWTAGPVVNNAPVLEWVDAPAFTDRGVSPDAATAGTTFRFAVRCKDADGDVPTQEQLHVQRLGPDGSWKTRKRTALVAGGSTTMETGRNYSAQVPLGNGVYRYRFEMADYASPAQGAPTRWHNGPAIQGGPPILTWVGSQGYEADGVEPDAGEPGPYSFQVKYADSEGDAAVGAELVLTRPAGKETRHELRVMPGGSWATGRRLRVTLNLKAVGDYAYRFEVSNEDGQAKALQAARPQTGPSVSDGTTSVSQPGGATQVTALVAAPTALGAEIRFSLSTAARVEGRVVSIAGRPVRLICRDSPCEAGPNTLIWNATNDAGLRVPDGLYLIEITARGADGDQARGLTSVHLGR